METTKKGSGIAFLPLLVFMVIYVGAGVYFQLQGVDYAFYQFPAAGAMVISIFLAFVLGIKKEKFQDTLNAFVGGIANNDIITMLLIYLMAGAFSGIASDMGGRDATVNLGLSLIPAQFLAAGVFIISAFMGTATGTSIGTISAVVPIAIGVADKGGLNVALVAGACVGGAIFGDNLSMISDTTIAATRTQGVHMKDKFRVNLLIALPAAILNIVLLLIFGRPETAAAIGDLDFNIIKVLPYIIVFILAIVGVNVFFVLAVGIVIASCIGMAFGDFTFAGAATALYNGITGMDEVFYMTLLAAGLAALTKYRGGIEWLISKLKNIAKTNKGSQLVIAFLVAVLDLAVANNTVAIILSGDISKNISKDYRIDPRKTASLLDIFSCVPQGLLPYSGQLLITASMATAFGFNLSAVNFIPYIWYAFLLCGFGLLSIFFPFAEKTIRKNPWNWEKDCREAEVQ